MKLKLSFKVSPRGSSVILIGLQLGYRYFQKKKINFKAANACSDLLKFSGEILPKGGLKAHIFGYLLNFSSSLYDS